MKKSKRLLLLGTIFVVFLVITLIIVHMEEEKERIANTDDIVYDLDVESVTGLSWHYEDVELSFSKDEAWTYDDDEAFRVDEDKINELLEVFDDFTAAFTISDVTDLSQYGLDDPTCTIDIKTADEDITIKLGDYSTMDAERYVTFDDETVYLASNDPYESYAIELKDMLDDDEAPAFDTIEGITFTGKENYEIMYDEDLDLTYSEDDDYYTVDDGKTIVLDTDRVRDYVNMIGELVLDEYMTYDVTDDELATYGLDDPEMIVSIAYTNEDSDGNKTEGEYVISISKDPSQDIESDEDEILAYIRIGDSPIIYTLDQDYYEAIMDASYDSFRHTELLWAQSEEISAIQVELEGELYTIEKREADNDDGYAWYFGDDEVDTDELIYAIEHLSVDTFISDEDPGALEISLSISIEGYDDEVDIDIYRYDGEYCIAYLDDEPLALITRSSAVDLIEEVNKIVLDQ